MSARRLMAIVATWAVLVIVLWAANAGPAVLALLGVVGAVLSVFFAGLDLVGASQHATWTSKRPIRADATAGEQVRARSRAAAWSGSTDLQSELVELVDDRLLANHGIDRAATPAKADALLSPRLRRLVNEPDRRVGAANDLNHTLNDIEAL